MQADPRIDEARARPILSVWEALGAPTALRPAGIERAGPCPVCGGRDRFAINPARNLWTCRRCGRGGDQIELVRHVLAAEFMPALDWLCGAREARIPAAELRRRAAAAAEAKRRQEEDSARFRREAIRAARAIWARAVPAAGTPVEGYFEARGAPLPMMPECLRFIPDHVYAKGRGAGRLVYHTGPAMIAAVTSPGEGITAVHQTWFDLSRPRGKAEILHPETGEKQGVKLVRGSKRSGAIRLHSSARMLAGDGGALVVGEGIETTATGWARGALKGASWWAGIDLGHMAGRMRRVAGEKWSGLPDMEDADCFRAPRGLTRLYFIMDGDSHPLMTRRKLESGLRRARARQPGLETLIVSPGAGVDLNDLTQALSRKAPGASGSAGTAGAADPGASRPKEPAGADRRSDP
ncbi:primase-helicase zinc-binding domain-containing protein [Pikeienuella sp. HZG-20]|uniref:DUF7146 domain-containing protein n=1 Tax=Paludibacillus litoralis TaxID=3133267 RepID=UPI0030ED7FB1